MHGSSVTHFSLGTISPVLLMVLRSLRHNGCRRIDCFVGDDSNATWMLSEVIGTNSRVHDRVSHVPGAFYFLCSIWWMRGLLGGGGSPACGLPTVLKDGTGWSSQRSHAAYLPGWLLRLSVCQRVPLALSVPGGSPPAGKDKRIADSRAGGER